VSASTSGLGAITGTVTPVQDRPLKPKIRRTFSENGEEA
jgi:hypothetical protein